MEHEPFDNSGVVLQWNWASQSERKRRGWRRAEGRRRASQMSNYFTWQKMDSVRVTTLKNWYCLLIICLTAVVPLIYCGTTMDSSMMEIIEEFMESALVHWVCHLTFITRPEEKVIIFFEHWCAESIRISQSFSVRFLWGCLHSPLHLNELKYNISGC